jgi:hypothetical protein
MEALEQRKQKIEAEIAALTQDIGQTVSEVKHEATAKMKSLARPETWVQRYPLTTVGLAIVGGVFLGKVVTKRASKMSGSVLRAVEMMTPVQEMPQTPAPKKKSAFTTFVKPMVSQLWEQYGPMIISAGQQVVAQKAAAFAEQKAREAQAANAPKKL